MLTTKTFLKKTKRGNILKIVREHYLRDDIWCGSPICKKCQLKPSSCVLDAQGLSGHTKFTFPHYILLDTNVVLDQIDVLEEDSLCNIIIIQTVIEEVKHRSSPVFKRLKEIIANPKRRVYTFVNEHHQETYVERKPAESANDRNDRAIRTAAKWYTDHLVRSQLKTKEEKRLQVVLLTDDANNRAKARAEGIHVCSAEEYINGMKDGGNLVDKLCRRSFSIEGEGKEPLFPLHLTPSQIQDGIKAGRLVQGTFHASRENFLEGSVNVDGMEKFVLVQGHQGLNRSVDGDTVAVELLPESEWSGPSEIILEDTGEDPGDILDDEAKMEKEKAVAVEKQPTGRVVGIVRRKWRQYCGILQQSALKGGTRHIFVPAERKIPKIRIETRQSEKLYNQRIIVAIDSWARSSRYPQGHFVRALGEIGDKNTENEVLLLEHDVPHNNFSEAVLSCLPTLPWIITDEDVKKRVDLRGLDICSVDPPGCTDIDDALHCRQLENGNFEVGVHIADVSHFIRPGTAIDKEAASRATTVYLVDKRIDMVPDLLSSNLCSLRGNEERFAFSCIWELTKDAETVDTKMHKSIICSKAALTYQEAQNKIDDKSLNDSLSVSLRSLLALSKILKRRRVDNGALVLASTEIRFTVDSETHDPVDVVAKKMLETMSMVEEFMLLANISVAERILAEFPECAVLRRHPEPPQSNFDPLVKAGRYKGFEINTESAKLLAESLDKAVKPDNPYFNTMLRIMATRCMMQAVYFASGTLRKEEYFHYALAFPAYTHFTSPIRRYADVIVHRLLAVCIGADSTYADLLDKRKSQDVCNNLNYRNRMAQYAGRASVNLNTHLFFRNRVQDEDGYVLFVRKNAVQVLIPKYGLEGTIFLSPPKGEVAKVTFVYNEEEHSQSCGSVKLRVFDPVTVQLSLDRTNIQHEKLMCKLVYPEISGFSVPSAKSAQTTQEVMDIDTPTSCSKATPKKKQKVK